MKNGQYLTTKGLKNYRWNFETKSIVEDMYRIVVVFMILMDLKNLFGSLRKVSFLENVFAKNENSD